MCRICDGATREQLNEEAATEIAVNGYMLQGVGDSEHSPWVYSVGLLDSSSHPELIVPGVAPEVSAPILRKLADAIVAGDGFKPGDSVVIDGRRLRFGEVHDVQYDLDTFAMWHELWHVDVIDAIELSALQVIFDPTDLCAACRARQVHLSDHDARVGGPFATAQPRRASPPEKVLTHEQMFVYRFRTSQSCRTPIGAVSFNGLGVFGVWVVAPSRRSRA